MTDKTINNIFAESEKRRRRQDLIFKIKMWSVFILIILFLFFGIFLPMINLNGMSSQRFCERQGYDGVYSSYSRYYGEVICFASTKDKFITQNFSVYKDYWGLHLKK